MNVDVTLSTYFSYHDPGWEAAAEYLSWEGPDGFKYPAASLGHPTEKSPWHDRTEWPEIIRFLQENEVQIAALHSPIEAEHDLTSDNPVVWEDTFEAHREAIEFASLLQKNGAAHGDKVWVVVHLLEPYNFAEEELEARVERGVDRWRRLLEEAQSYPGAEPVLENLGGNKIRQRVIELVWRKTGYLGGICFDTGHLKMDPDRESKLEEFAEHSRVMHLQDNRGNEDEHLLASLDDEWNRRCLEAVRERGEEFELVIQEHRGDKASREETLSQAERVARFFDAKARTT